MTNLMRATIVLLLGLLASSTVLAQPPTNDTLNLEQAIQLAVSNHPLVERARQNIKVSQAQVGLANSNYYPDISGDANYTRIGPVSKITIPELGNFELFPANNWDIHVGINQTLYDFGRRSTGVDFAEANLKTTTDSLDFVKWNLAYQTASTFYLILILHQNIAVLDEQIAALNEHLDISQKRFQTGSATKLDILTTEVRVASANSNRIDAVNALKTQEINLRQLIGYPPDKPIDLLGDFVITPVTLKSDSLLAAAMSQRMEIRTFEDAEKSASLQVKLAGLSDKPTLSVGLISGLKNGYIPNLNQLKANYVATVNLQMSLFDGFRTRHNKEMADARLLGAEARTGDAKRRITAEVEQAISGTQASLNKINNAEVQVKRAEEALAMAQAQYNAGVVTNLDLLDAQTSLSEARLVYLRAKYDYVNNLNTLDRATGRKIWE